MGLLARGSRVRSGHFFRQPGRIDRFGCRYVDLPPLDRSSGTVIYIEVGMTTKRTKRADPIKATFYIDADVVAALDTAAKITGRSKSEVLTEVLRAALPRPGRKVAVPALAGKTPADALARARVLVKQGHAVKAIVPILNREGYTTKQGRPWAYHRLWQLLKAD